MQPEDNGREPASLLDVADLRIHIGRAREPVVRGVSFRVAPGERVGLAGHSGSGKSLTALSLGRLLPRSLAVATGQVRLQGVKGNLLELPERTLRGLRGSRMAYVFQEPSGSFNPLFTIGSHLRELHARLGGPRQEREKAVRQALEAVGIPPDPERLAAFPSQFSGGMLQRVAIACACMARPDLLIADEPTTALDTTTQKRIGDLLLDLNQRQGMAILFISHDLGLLRQLTSRLLLMHEGRLIEEGPTAQVLENPRHPVTREMIRCAPRLRLPGP